MLPLALIATRPSFCVPPRTLKGPPNRVPFNSGNCNSLSENWTLPFTCRIGGNAGSIRTSLLLIR